jgi:hypothetical protein
MRKPDGDTTLMAVSALSGTTRTGNSARTPPSLRRRIGLSDREFASELRDRAPLRPPLDDPQPSPSFELWRHAAPSAVSRSDPALAAKFVLRPCRRPQHDDASLVRTGRREM